MLVVDAKYKQFSDATEGTDRPSNADLYQMAAACVAHRCGRALLVYPRLPQLQGDEDLGASWQPRWWRIALPSSGEVMVGAAAVPLDWLNDGDRAERFDQNLAHLVVTASGVSA